MQLAQFCKFLQGKDFLFRVSTDSANGLAPVRVLFGNYLLGRAVNDPFQFVQAGGIAGSGSNPYLKRDRATVLVRHARRVAGTHDSLGLFLRVKRNFFMRHELQS